MLCQVLPKAFNFYEHYTPLSFTRSCGGPPFEQFHHTSRAPRARRWRAPRLLLALSPVTDTHAVILVAKLGFTIVACPHSPRDLLPWKDEPGLNPQLLVLTPTQRHSTANTRHNGRRAYEQELRWRIPALSRAHQGPGEALTCKAALSSCLACKQWP